MKDYELLDAVGGIDEKYIRQASNESRRNKHWAKWGALAACLCLVVGGLFSAPLLKAPTDDPEPNQSGAVAENDEKTPSSAIDTNTPQIADHTKEGILIPAIELPEATGNVEFDMIGLVVYRGGIYTQAGSYWGEDAKKIDMLVGDYLGYATGTINEWSTQDEYAQEFASTIAGEVYAVNGYDTSFRVCIRQEVEGEDGEPTLWIEFLDRLNGISISTGKDIFEDRLHLSGRVISIQWQSHDDWNHNRGNIQDASFDQSVWTAFLDTVNQGEFINTWMPNESFYDDHPNSSIYATPNQAHLILTMEDGTTVRLRLIEDGYVGYESVGWWYFVKIPGEVFDAVYNSCGGTHLTDW